MTQESTSTDQFRSSTPTISSITTTTSYRPSPISTFPRRASSHGGARTASILQKLCGFFSPQGLPSSTEKEPGLEEAPGKPSAALATAGSVDYTNAGITRARRRSAEEFGSVFRYFDENGDGKISPSELRSCMRSVGEELSAADAEAVVESTDSDGDGLLSFDDFVKLVDVGGEEERIRDLREAFSMYEMKGGDCITPKSLRRMLRRLHVSKTIDECKVMIRPFDLNGDGVLSFDEFKLMML